MKAEIARSDGRVIGVRAISGDRIEEDQSRVSSVHWRKENRANDHHVMTADHRLDQIGIAKVDILGKTAILAKIDRALLTARCRRLR